MNTNPLAKTVLCYGDSNTFGQRSDDVAKGRWPADIRWTGRLQLLLGNDYSVVEEGLSSRTTDINYAKKPGRNGRTYLVPCLQSHNPIHTVVLMLGTNDFKDEFKRTSQDVADAVAGLVLDIKDYAYAADQPTDILIVSPIVIDATAQNFAQLYGAKYGADSAQKSRELAACLQKVAHNMGCAFFDAADVAHAGIDGLHLSADSHEPLAQVLAQAVTAKRRF
jgi:lysophospholipase L1-like esterase